MKFMWIYVLTFLFAIPVGANAENLFQVVEDSQFDRAPEAKKLLIKKAKQKPTTKTVRVIKINTELLKNPSVKMNLRSDLIATVQARKVERRTDKKYTWYGNISEVPGDAILVINGDNVTGTVRRGKALFRIRPIGSGDHALIEVDVTKFPADHPPGYDKLEKMKDSSTKRDKIISEMAYAHDLSKTIKVMVLYTANANSATTDMASLIQLAIDETNSSYQNSGITASLQLAHSAQVSYNESTRSWSEVVNHLKGTSDGQMDNIHTWRNSHEADVVVIIIDKSSACGLAAAIKANSSTAFAAVHYDCATGYYSFGHEIGHLQGARHNCAADSTLTPYDYGHGYQYQNSWRTVMSYNCSSDCTRINYWSNPNILYNNVKMGNTCSSGSGCKKEVKCCANNARVLNDSASYVAGFRPLPSTPSCGVGKKCCEPNPSGGCFLCWPSANPCP